MRLLLLVALLGAVAAECEWIKLKRARNDTLVRLTFALPYSNEEETDRISHEISNPSSPRFRQFLSATQVRELTSPNPDARKTVQSFLEARFPAVEQKWSTWGHFLHIRLTVHEVEDLLSTTCFVYQYSCDTNWLTVKTSEDTFPSFELSPVLQYIGGATRFPLFHNHRPKPRRKPESPPENETLTSLVSIDDFDPELVQSALRDLRDGDGTLNPIQFSGGDGQVVFLVVVLCPDGFPLTAQDDSAACIDGSQLRSITIRYAMGSQAQKTKEFDGRVLRCAPTPELMCEFVISLEENYVRYAFGFDYNYNGGTTYTYNMQSYVTGTEDLNVSFVKRFYSMPDGIVAKNKTNFQAIGALALHQDVEHQGYYSTSDLKGFYTVSNIPAGNADLVDFRGSTNIETSPDVETTLDIQWITGLGVGAKSSVWHTAAADPESFESIISQVQASADKGETPWVLSFSYGGRERLFSTLELSQHEAGFRSLGLLGISVLVASGDTGPYWDDCLTFEPSYPASSQYVTAVGATQLLAQNLHNVCTVTETACSFRTGSQITSGGGFSLSFPRPTWQTTAVDQYLSGELPDMKYNKQGRAYPDIALFGRSFDIVYRGRVVQVDGTSASSPALGGMISLINDARFNTGKKALGFLNPLLYQMAQEAPDAFNDIFLGSNDCSRQMCCSEGFKARAGWDPVTGLGTPIFPRFAAYLEANFSGSFAPVVFPEDLDCAEPQIQPNPVNIWKTRTQWIVIGAAILVALLGVAAIVWYWRRKQRQQVHVQGLQNVLVNRAET